MLIRRKYPEIARGSYKALSCDDASVGGFVIDGMKTVIIHNTSAESVTVDIAKCVGKPHWELCDVIGASPASLENDVLTVGAQTSVILKPATLDEADD